MGLRKPLVNFYVFSISYVFQLFPDTSSTCFQHLVLLFFCGSSCATYFLRRVLCGKFFAVVFVRHIFCGNFCAADSVRQDFRGSFCATDFVRHVFRDRFSTTIFVRLILCGKFFATVFVRQILCGKFFAIAFLWKFLCGRFSTASFSQQFLCGKFFVTDFVRQILCDRSFAADFSCQKIYFRNPVFTNHKFQIFFIGCVFSIFPALFSFYCFSPKLSPWRGTLLNSLVPSLDPGRLLNILIMIEKLLILILLFLANKWTRLIDLSRITFILTVKILPSLFPGRIFTMKILIWNPSFLQWLRMKLRSTFQRLRSTLQ